MRLVFSGVGLLVVVVIVALLVRKNLGSIAHTQQGTVPNSAASMPTSNNLPNQVGASVDQLMQQARPVPEDK